MTKTMVITPTTQPSTAPLSHPPHAASPTAATTRDANVRYLQEQRTGKTTKSNYLPDFIIRLMAQRTHDLFEAAHDALLSQTILDTLNLNKIVQDFKLPEPDESPFDKLLDGLH